MIFKDLVLIVLKFIVCEFDLILKKVEVYFSKVIVYLE